MVNQKPTLTEVFGAVADPTRRDMLDRLRGGPRTVSDLGAPFPMTLAAVGKHVAALESAGLIHTAKTGRVRMCTLVPGGLSEAEEWMAEQNRFWNTRLDALTAHLQGES